jgi:hypothetical protein
MLRLLGFQARVFRIINVGTVTIGGNLWIKLMLYQECVNLQKLLIIVKLKKIEKLKKMETVVLVFERVIKTGMLY